MEPADAWLQGDTVNLEETARIQEAHLWGLQRLQCSFLCARDPEEKMEKIVPKPIRGRQTANSIVCIEKVLT